MWYGYFMKNLLNLFLLFFLSSNVFAKGVLLICEDSKTGKDYASNKYFTLKSHPDCGLEKPSKYADIKFDTNEDSAVIEYFSCNTQGMTSYWEISYTGTLEKLPDAYVIKHKNPNGYNWEQRVSRKDLTISGTQVNGVCKMEEIKEEENLF